MRTQTESFVKSEIKSKVKILYDFSGVQLELEKLQFSSMKTRVPFY